MMFNYQIRVIGPGEIFQSDFIYKYPHTAKVGARAFLRRLIDSQELRLDDKAELKIFDQRNLNEPIIHLGGKPTEIRTLDQWLSGKFTEKERKTPRLGG